MNKLITLIFLISATAQLSAAEQLLDEIVAIVEEDVILRSELDRSVKNVTQQFRAKGVQLPPTSVLEEQVLDRLIIMELQNQKADLAGVRVSDAEVDAALTQVASQNGLTLQQLQLAVENDGLSFADFRGDMVKEIKSEKIRNGLAEQNVQVTENEIDLFLADNELSQGEVRLGHILVAMTPESDAETTEKTKAKVEDLVSKLDQGQDFNQLAAEFSDGQNALEGGDLGWRPVNELPTLFSEQIKLMKKGDYTRPIRSASGYHIIKMLDKKENEKKMITEYNTSHIMIQNSELVTPQQGMEIINGIHKDLLAGGDFAKIAEEKSDDVNSAALGGDLGWIQLMTYGQRFADVLNSLDDGETSAPFQTQAGWHIIKRIGKRQNDVTENFKRAQASQAIKGRKMNEEIERWLREIRAEAFVDIKL